MTSSIIYGKYVISGSNDNSEVQAIENGAIFQRDGVIEEIGTYQEITAKYQPDLQIGSSDAVILPGFVNSHHHAGLTPFQLGSLNAPLEIWLTSRISARNVDPYLDTLYSAFEMVESGITTVQHIDMWQPSSTTAAADALKRADKILQAYQDVGMRASYSLAFRDQNRLVYGSDEDFIQQLPPHLGQVLTDRLKVQIPIQEHLQIFEELWQTWHQKADRIQIQLAPANLQWCSDDALLQLKDYANQYHVGLHMHLLETPYQKEYAKRRSGKTAVQHLNDLGILGANLTLGHGVWLTQADIELIAQTNTLICHNASSNLSLQSGIAPINEFLRQGVQVAIGMDQANINEERDILQEMRLVLNLHRVPGIDAIVPTTSQVFQMATEHGAKTTGFADQIGTLKPGKAADMVLMNWKQITYPFLDDTVPVLDAVLHRSRTTTVETVIVAGEPILDKQKFTKIDKHVALEELAQSLQVPLTAMEYDRRQLAQELIPHVKNFYQNWLNNTNCHPFDCRNCQH